MRERRERFFNESIYLSLPVLSLSTECRYDKMAESLGGKGWLVRTKDEITNALKEVRDNSPSSLSLSIDYQADNEKGRPTLINILIATDAERKPQKDHWLTRSNQ